MHPLNSRFQSLLLLAVGLLLALWLTPSGKAYAAASTEDEQSKAFIESLYGERILKAQRTRDEDDNIELMSEMLDIVSTLPKQPDVRTALYLRIVEMADTSKVGYEKALEALDALAEHNSNHPSSGPQAKLDVFDSWYRAGGRDSRIAVGKDYFEALLSAADDAIARGDLANAKRWYNEAGSVQRVARVAKDIDLRERLAVLRGAEKRAREADRFMEMAKLGELRPNQARRLIVILALEQGNIYAAKAYGQATDDESYRKGLLAAAAFEQALAEEKNSEARVEYAYHAGLWYAEMSKEPALSDQGKRRALELGRDALRYHVTQTQKNNVEKARATILLRQLDEQYAQAYSSTPDKKDLLALLDPSEHTIAGQPFTTEEGKLILPAKSILHVPVVGGDHYALTILFSGDGRAEDGLVIWLPIHGRSIRFFVDGSTHHRALAEGLVAIENSAEIMLVEPNEMMQLRIEVRHFEDDEVAMKVWHGGKQVWNWRGQSKNLKTPPFGTPPNLKHFSLSGGGGLKIESLQIVEKEGKAE